MPTNDELHDMIKKLTDKVSVMKENMLRHAVNIERTAKKVDNVEIREKQRDKMRLNRQIT